MKFGNFDIKRLFLGDRDVSDVSWLGNIKIVNTEPEPELNYLWLQPMEDVDWNIQGSGLCWDYKDTFEYSTNKKTWNKCSDIPHSTEQTSISDYLAENPTATILALSRSAYDQYVSGQGLSVTCYYWGGAQSVHWCGKAANLMGVDDNYAYYVYDIGGTPVNVIWCLAQSAGGDMFNPRYQTADMMSIAEGTIAVWNGSDWGGSRESAENYNVTSETYSDIHFNAGDVVYFRNTTRWSCGSSNYGQKFIAKDIQLVDYNIGGDIETIQDYLNMTDVIDVGFKYYYLFSGDAHITDASELVLGYTTLTEGCYRYMFYKCSSLVGVPELPATTLTAYCYEYMFNGCTSLVTAPELPATTLKDYCYRSMFGYCSSLTTAPELPATTMYAYCYSSMFYSCSSLTTAPELPATILKSWCYGNMFFGCRVLTQAPELPAEELVGYCYYWMFYLCESLNNIKCLATTTVSGATSSWVSGVPSTGTFIKSPDATFWTTGTSGIPSGWTVIDAEPDRDYFYIQPLSDVDWTPQDGELVFDKQATFGFSLDKDTWYSVDDIATVSTPLTIAEYLDENTEDTICVIPKDYYNGLYAKGYNLYYAEGDADLPISEYEPQQAKLLAEDTNSLYFVGRKTVDYTRFIWFMSDGSDMIYSGGGDIQYRGYVYDFKQAKVVKSYENDTIAPLTTGTLHVSAGTKVYFRNTEPWSCSGKTTNTWIAYNLQHVPYNVGGDIETIQNYLEPSSTIGTRTYDHMFYDDRNLISAADLKIEYDSCGDYALYDMFQRCSSMISAPKIGIDTLGQYACNNMFYQCTSLTTMPELPATNLAKDCYSGMFYQCTSIEDGVILPATTLAENCYRNMFNGCTSLKSAHIYATTFATNGCRNMFNGCGSLVQIQAMFLDAPNDNVTYDWVKGVGTDGTFLMNNDATWSVFGTNGIPSGWGVVKVS